MCSYKAIRTRVNNLNINLKKQYFAHKIIEYKGNMKETWKTTNALALQTTNALQKEKLNSMRRDILNTMNDYFCTIDQELADEIDLRIPSSLVTI